MDPIEKAIRAVEAAAEGRQPQSEKVRAKTVRERDEERLKRADEPWNKAWITFVQGGAPQ